MNPLSDLWQHHRARRALATYLVPVDGAATMPDWLRAHLGACARCAAETAEWAAHAAHVREAIEAEADEAFTAHRLTRQRLAIQRRLAHDGAAARVLAFPLRRHADGTARVVPRRWVAAAAAMGLLVGAVTGRYVGTAPGSGRPTAGPTAAFDRPTQVREGTASQRVGVPEALSDEAFLVEFEAAVLAPRFEPLRSLDEMTPRVVETAARPR